MVNNLNSLVIGSYEKVAKRVMTRLDRLVLSVFNLA